MTELAIVISARNQAQAALNQVKGSIGDVQKQAKSASESLKSMGGSLTSLGTKLTLGVTAPILGFAGAALRAAANQEQLQVAFTTMLGSAEKAKRLMGDIAEFSASTPFQFDEVVSAGRSLLAFGVNASQVTDTLRRLGDVSAGVSAPLGEIAEIYGKAKVAGRIFAEDINQLTGRGIPVIAELAKVLGVAEGEVKKLVEEGKVGFPELEQVFQNLTAQGGQFAGLMEAQSRTVGGLFSTLKDVASLALNDIGAKLIETFDLRNKLAGAIEVLDGIKNTILSFADANPELFNLAVTIAGVAAALGPMAVGLGFVLNAVAGVLPVLGALGAALAALISPLGLVAAAIAAAFYFDVGGIRTATGEIISTIADMAQQVYAQLSQLTLQDVLDSLSGVLESLDGPIQRVKDSFTGLFNNVNVNSEVFGKVAEAVQNLFDALTGNKGESVNIAEMLGGGAAVVTLNLIASSLEAIGPIVSALVGQLETSLNAAADIINGLALAINGLASGDTSQALQGLQQILEGLGGFITGTFGNAATLVGDLATVLGNLAVNTLSDLGFTQAAEQVSAFNSTIGTTVESITGALTNAITGLLATSQENWPAIKAAATAALGVINDALKKISEFLTTTLPSAFNSFKTFLAGLGLPNPFSVLNSAISTLTGALDGIRSKFDSLKNYLGNLSLPNPFSGLNLPSIPGLATGGPVRSSGFYNVGEGGRPETVFLPKGSYVANPYQMQAAGIGGGGVTVNLYATINNGLDVEEIAYKVARKIKGNGR